MDNRSSSGSIFLRPILNPAIVVVMKTYITKSPDAHTQVISFNNRKLVARELKVAENANQG